MSDDAAGKDIDQDNAEKKHEWIMHKNQMTFVSGVDGLCNQQVFDSKHINQLMATFINTVTSEKCKVSFSNDINHVGYWGERRRKSLGAIVLPYDFYQRVKQNPIMEFGPIVKMASLVRDNLSNNNVPDESMRRSEAFESEYIMTHQRAIVWWLPSGYHMKLRYKYPDGIASLDKSLIYWKIT